MSALDVYPTVQLRHRPLRSVGLCSYGHDGVELWDGVCAECLGQEGQTRRPSPLRAAWRCVLGACWLLGYLVSLLIGGVFCTSPFWIAVIYLHTQGVI